MCDFGVANRFSKGGLPLARPRTFPEGSCVKILIERNHPMALHAGHGSNASSPSALRMEGLDGKDLWERAVAEGADAVVVEVASAAPRHVAHARVEAKTRTLVLCLHPVDEPLGAQAIVATACAFLLTSAAVADVYRVVAEAHVRTCARARPPRAQGLMAATTAPSGTLSAREQLILTFLAQEKTSKEIAVALGISPRTVDAQRSILMKKLGVQSTVGLVCYAVGAGLVGP